MPNPNEQNQNPVEIPYQEVNYHGATVSQELKEKLEATDARDYLSFRPVPDSNAYIMQAKFPEKGRDKAGNEYDIRVNLNYLMRGAARYILDGNGNIDVQKVNQLYDLGQAFSEDKFPQELMDLCEIPSERLDDFKRFVAANKKGYDVEREDDRDVRGLLGVGANYNPLMYISTEVGYLVQYQYLLRTREDLNTPKAQEERKHLLESYPAVRNILESYHKMRDMDPLTETDLFYPMECDSLGQQYENLMIQAQDYQKEHDHNHQSDVTFREHILRMPDIPDDPKKIKQAFSSHVYFTMTTTIDGQPVTISLENTAAPANLMFTRPEPIRTGVGIFRDEAEVEQYHLNKNELKGNDLHSAEVSANLKNIIVPDENIPKLFSLNELSLDVYKANLNQAGLDPEHEDQMTDAQKAKLNELRNKYRDELYENMQIEVESQRQILQQRTLKHRYSDIDYSRYHTKETLAYLTNEETGAYSADANGDAQLTDIINDVRKYSSLDVTAVWGDYSKERELVKGLKEKLNRYIEDLEKQDAQTNYTASNNETFRSRYLIAANLQNLLSGQSDGLLAVPKQLSQEERKKKEDEQQAREQERIRAGKAPQVALPEEHPIFVDGVNHAPEHDMDIMRDATNDPLFPHDPSPSDISQGYLGNCYMIASLSTLASRFPQKIRESMVDNGNGTVTVRFFQNHWNEETGQVDRIDPVYVTVDKKFPMVSGSEDCLWVQMLERAYAASGLHLCEEDPRAVPENIDALYQQYKQDQKAGKPLPTHEECPWLIDEFNQLHPWKPSYEMIESGRANEFLSEFLGSDNVKRETIYPTSLSNQERLDKHGKERKDFLDITNILNVIPIAESFTKHDKWQQTVSPTVKLEAILLNDPSILGNLSNRTTLPAALPALAQSLSSAIQGQAQKQVEKNGFQNFDWAPHIQNYKELLNKAINGTLQENDPLLAGVDKQQWKDIADSIQLFNIGLLGRPPEQQDTVRQRAIENLSAVVDRWLPGHDLRPFIGEYTSDENKLFQSIQEHLNRGDLVNAGTRGESDKIVVNGIVERHAYSVLSISEHSLYEGGPVLKFIQVRNPHGETGMKYDVDPQTHEVTPVASSCEDTGGIFEIELRDFTSSFDSVYINDLSLEMRKSNPSLSPEKRQELENQNKQEKAPAQQEASVQQEAEPLMTYKELGEAARPLRDALKRLTDTNSRLVSSSKEYTEFFKKLEDFLQNNRGSATMTDYSNVLRSVQKAANQYLNYCNSNPKSGSRREARMQDAKLVSNLAKAYSEKKDPAESIKEQLAGELTNILRDTQIATASKGTCEMVSQQWEDKNFTTAFTNALKNDASFKQFTKGKDLKALSDMTLLDRKELYTQFEKARKEYSKQVDAQKKAQAKQAVRQNSLPQRQSNAHSK